MRRNRYYDQLIGNKIAQIANSEPYFTVSEVVFALTNVRTLARLRADLNSRYSSIGGDFILMEFLREAVADALKVKDANGIRLYEGYRAGSDYRYMRLRAMSPGELRTVMQDTSSAARKLEIKASGIAIFLQEMERLGSDVINDAVYEAALPKILELRKTA